MNGVRKAPTLLIVGAADYSLGQTIAAEAQDGPYDFAEVATAGIQGEEHKLDVTNTESIFETLVEVKPDIMVCTVGINVPASISDTFMPLKMTDSFRINTIGPLELLHHFVRSEVWPGRDRATKKFVAVSSNSAHIARTGSVAYCASKAALSMGLRAAARELAGSGIHVWGYEPGLLAGTPMTRETEAAFAGPLHRMKGVPDNGLAPGALARRIVSDIGDYSPGFNGTMFRFDGGEQ